jgi:aspartyl-tRNA(Asn)/glutamyl-tRNA(Gln) amidotransferase subunit A
MTDIWKKPAHELARLIRERQLSSREVVGIFLDRIRRLNGPVNAFALIDEDEALRGADTADAEVSSGACRGPLHGLPVHVKDLLPTAGMRTALGSIAFENNIPKHDAGAIARVRDAGGIIIGKTTTPELGHKVLTDSPLHGVTRNPWSLEHSPGGSSGGAAVAVAMGFGPLGVSTDGAGSGRIPAACCGIVGLKPTLGAVPHETSPDLFGSLTCIGSMARDVEDLVMLHNVMAGPDRRDPWSFGGSKTPLRLADDPLAILRGLRVMWLPRTVNSHLNSDVETHCSQAVSLMVEGGAMLVEGPEQFDWALDEALLLMRSYQGTRFKALLARWRDRMDSTTVASIEDGEKLRAETVRQALFARTDLLRRIQALFDHADVIVTPTVSAPALPASQRADEPLTVDGIPIGSLRENWYSYTIPFNPSGNPAISVPCGFAANGIPVGLQVVAPWHEEQRLVAVAAALSHLKPWRHAWPSLAVEAERT